MKHLLTFFLLLFSASFVMAQETTSEVVSRRGEAVLPAAGNWSVFINADPFFSYVGNFFSNVPNQPPYLQFSAENPGTIMGRYFLANQNAILGAIHLGYTHTRTEPQNTTNPDLRNTRTNVSYNYGLGAGAEFGTNRRRWRPYAGGMATVFINRLNNETFVNAADNTLNYETNGGNGFTLRLMPFIGGEFYFLPKIAVGGRLGMHAIYHTRNETLRVIANGNEIFIAPATSSFLIEPSLAGNIYFSFTL